MGGRCIKTVPVRRYTTEELFILYEELSLRMQDFFQTKVYTPKFLYDKETHGDLDILLKLPIHKSVIDFIQSLNSKEFHKNGNIYSFEYKEFQIDIILMNEDCFDNACHFHNFNDMGNFIGKLARQLGLRYGYQGLFYSIKDFNNNTYDKLILSTNFDDILGYLDLNKEVYYKGFNTIEDVYLWLSNSKYFNKRIYDPSFWLSHQKHRDKQRKNVMGLYDWVVKMNLEVPEEAPLKDPIKWIRENINIDIDSILHEYTTLFRNAEFLKIKFNGTLVSTYTQLIGKELGLFIKVFKTYIEQFKDFNTWALESDPKEIKETILKFKDIYYTH